MRRANVSPIRSVISLVFVNTLCKIYAPKQSSKINNNISSSGKTGAVTIDYKQYQVYAIHYTCVKSTIILFSFNSSFACLFIYFVSLSSRNDLCLQLIIHCSHFLLLLLLLVLFCVAFATRIFFFLLITDYFACNDFKLRSKSTKTTLISNFNGHEK